MRAPLAERIEAVDLTSPSIDTARVDAALSTHLDRLGLQPRRVWWANDVASARRTFTASREAREWWPARSRSRAAAQAVGWRPMTDVLETQGLRLVDLPRTVSVMSGFRELAVDSVLRIAATWEAVESATRAGGGGRRSRRKTKPDDPLPPNPVAPWLVDAVAWSSAPAPFSRAAAVVRWTEACAALAEAYLAGLGFFSVLQDWTIAVPRPALSVVDGVLHNADGPAVAWLDGERYWFVRGLRVTQGVVEEPESITVADVHREPNVEVRSVVLERMGFDRYVHESGGRLVAEDDFGRLWRCRSLPYEREPLTFVEVLNGTHELDGSTRPYFLRVPPTVTTPHEAVAWSFGLAASQYAPAIES